MNKDNTFPARIARFLLLGILVSILFSPPITNLFELFCYALFLFCRDLRQIVWIALQQPMVKTALLLFFLIAAGVSYSAAPLDESLKNWISWRKLLLVPMAFAVFDNQEQKLKIAWTFVLLILFCCRRWLDSFNYFLRGCNLEEQWNNYWVHGKHFTPEVPKKRDFQHFLAISDSSKHTELTQNSHRTRQAV